MENEQNGFKRLSEVAGDSLDRESVGGTIAAGAKDIAGQATQKLKALGIDADGVIEEAEEHVTDLQDILMKELRDRPFRALGWAAAAGFVLGIMSAR